MAQATVYYLDGNQSVGNVCAWKPNSGQITLTSPQDDSAIELQWPLIAHVDRPLHASRLGKREEFQIYIINLVNGQTLSGAMISAAVISSGVEVWHAFDKTHLVERFIPWQAIKTYKLGHVEVQAGTAHACKLGVPFARLDDFDIDPKAIKFIPATTAARLGILPLMFHERRLVVALSNPSDTEALNILNFLAGYREAWAGKACHPVCKFSDSRRHPPEGFRYPPESERGLRPASIPAE